MFSCPSWVEPAFRVTSPVIDDRAALNQMVTLSLLDLYVNVNYDGRMEPTTETAVSPSTLFSIGDLASELGISTRTIRYYEERGLIAPQRTDGGQRIYTRRERGRLKLILRAKLAGFDLAEVKEVLEIYDAAPSETAEKVQAVKLIEMTHRRLAEIRETIAELSNLQESLEEHLVYLHELAGTAVS